jgi:hypothetical protein
MKKQKKEEQIQNSNIPLSKQKEKPEQSKPHPSKEKIKTKEERDEVTYLGTARIMENGGVIEVLQRRTYSRRDACSSTAEGLFFDGRLGLRQTHVRRNMIVPQHCTYLGFLYVKFGKEMENKVALFYRKKYNHMLLRI